MSRRPQPSLQCVVRDAAHDCSEFHALCDALQRNDPTVTTVTTHLSSTPEGYGHHLGEALLSNNNSEVSEIDLDLWFFLSVTDRRGQTTNSATALSTWIEQSSSLRTVTLRTRYLTCARCFAPISELLLQCLVNSMKKNSNIRSFHSHIYTFPLPLLTEYLSSTNTVMAMQSLRIEIPYMESEMDQAALAIAALSALQKLSLVCSIQFLRRLPVHSTRLLRELFVHFGKWIPLEARDVTLLSSILSSSTDLKHVTIEQLLLDNGNWTLVQSGLQANPSITHLKLVSCHIYQETGSLIVNHIQSNSMTANQNLRSLELSDLETGILSTGQDRFSSQSRLAQMLCSSLLQHATFDLQGMTDHAIAAFFDVLATNSSAVRLRSMHLKAHLLWDMTAYLSSNVHLRHFTFTFIPGRLIGDEFAVVPLSFLRSLRHNGSLHTVEFKNEQGQAYIPSDYAARMIQAYTTRNRKVADSMKSSFHTAIRTEVNGRDITRDLDAASATRQKRFPALSRVSHQAERMAPNSMLQGLLASSDRLDAMSHNSSRVLGKRMAASALEDA